VKDRGDHGRIRTAPDPHRHASDLDFNQTGHRLGLAPWRLPLSANGGRRRWRIHHCRHKPRVFPFRLGMAFSHLPAPAKQLLR
jgi:hypothetical protein